jgi:FkbM family methyltransferase
MRKFLRRLRYYYRCFGLRGLLFDLRERLTTQSALVSVIPPGAKHPLSLRLKTSDLRVYGQVFINREYDFELACPPQVIVDAGANIGLASIYYAIKYPTAKILALEPAHSNFLMLEQNVTPYPNILPIHAALWKENTEIELIDPGYGSWGFQTTDRGVSEPAQVLEKVPALTIDRIMTEYGIDFVDILKIDIEGSEKEVFEQPPIGSAK